MGLRILILEDDATLRRQLGRVFTARGCEVVETATVAAFVAAARDGGYDACLLDLSLPDGNGLDAWELVRTHQRRALAVAMSAEATPEASARARGLGCERLLAKPFDLAALLAAYAPLWLLA
jgi:two-component system OmpR family response regulator